MNKAILGRAILAFLVSLTLALWSSKFESRADENSKNVPTEKTSDVEESLGRETDNLSKKRNNDFSDAEQQIRDILQKIGPRVNKERQEIIDTLKDLGPRLTRAEQRISDALKAIGSALGETEQKIRIVSKGISKLGQEAGTTFEETSKDLRNADHATKRRATAPEPGANQ